MASSHNVSMHGKVRSLGDAVGQLGADVEHIVRMTEQGAQLMAPDGSPWEETVRAGAFELHTVTAIAAVVARPTTAHMLALYNNETDDGTVIVIDRVWALNEVSTAVASQCTLLGCLGQIREAVPTNQTTVLQTSLNGKGVSDPKTLSILNATALPAGTGIAGNWRVLPSITGGIKTGAATTPGYFANAAVDGRIIVPAGRYFAAHVMANVVGETFTIGIEWHRKNSKIA